MWEQVDYSFDGEHFTVPYAAQHPPQAVRQGSPADLGRVRQPAHVHAGRRARHRRHRLQLRADLQPAGPHRRLQGRRRQLHRPDRPVQERQRDDHQLGDLLRDPRGGPRDRAAQGPRLPRHDGEPVPRHDAEVAGRDHVAEHAALAHATSPPATRTRCSTASSRAATCSCGTPDEVSEQIAALGRRRHGPARVRPARSRAWTTTRSSPCLELFGDKVIPEFDKDRTHSTDHYRADGASRSTARSPSRCPTTSSGRRSSRRARSRRSPEPARPTLVPRDATATKERAPPRGGAAVRAARALPGDGPRDHRGGRAAQRVRAQLPLRLARRAARRDPVRHGDPTDVARGELLARVGRDAPTRELVAALVVPYAAHLATPERPRLPAHRRPAVGRVQHVARAEPGTGRYLRRDPRRSSKQRPPRSARRGPARARRRDDHAHDRRDGGTGPR